MSAPGPHLWERDPPFFMTQWTEKADSWAAFRATYANLDPDRNVLVCWRWWRLDHADPSHRRDLARGSPPDELNLYFAVLHKSRVFDVRVTVTPADEPAVRAFLADALAHVLTTWWAPIVPAPAAPSPALPGKDPPTR